MKRQERITVGAAKALLARARRTYEGGDVLAAHRLAVKALLWANDRLHSLELRRAAFRDNTLYVRKLRQGPKGRDWTVTGASPDGKSLAWARPIPKKR